MIKIEIKGYSGRFMKGSLRRIVEDKAVMNAHAVVQLRPVLPVVDETAPPPAPPKEFTDLAARSSAMTEICERKMPRPATPPDASSLSPEALFTHTVSLPQDLLPYIFEYPHANFIVVAQTAEAAKAVNDMAELRRIYLESSIEGEEPISGGRLPSYIKIEDLHTEVANSEDATKYSGFLLVDTCEAEEKGSSIHCFPVGMYQRSGNTGEIIHFRICLQGVGEPHRGPPRGVDISDPRHADEVQRTGNQATYLFFNRTVITRFHSGFGTFQALLNVVAEAVKEAFDARHRYIDCAMLYGNEKEVGQAIAESMEKYSSSVDLSP
ncbi:hypothetical protein Aperf_G00000085700 [Anoplocephala perfoliata]